MPNQNHTLPSQLAKKNDNCCRSVIHITQIQHFQQARDNFVACPLPALHVNKKMVIKSDTNLLPYYKTIYHDRKLGGNHVWERYNTHSDKNYNWHTYSFGSNPWNILLTLINDKASSENFSSCIIIFKRKIQMVSISYSRENLYYLTLYLSFCGQILLNLTLHIIALNLKSTFFEIETEGFATQIISPIFNFCFLMNLKSVWKQSKISKISEHHWNTGICLQEIGWIKKKKQ